MDWKLGILGLGNMGTALLDGILQQKLLSAKEIVGFDILTNRRKEIEEQFQIATRDLQEICDSAGLIILAVKPYDLTSLLGAVQHKLSDKVICSICAGITISDMENIIGTDKKIIRVMSNTPLLIGEGASCLACNPNVIKSEKDFVLNLLQGVGLAFEIEERLMDAVTGLSGSGPAYVFLFLEALADGGVKAGLPRDLAMKLAAQTVLGAAKLLLTTEKHPGELKDMVTSPGGTTIEGIGVLEKNAFRSGVIEAVSEAAKKAQSMKKE